jgi:dipeptidyl aminopeptidase/acylaminoacyl peptidase
MRQCTFLVVALIAAVIFGCKRDTAAKAPQQPARHGEVASDDLATARAAYATHIIHFGPSPQPYKEEYPPEGVKAVKYSSGKLSLRAWVSSEAIIAASQRKPAVVWLHGGFAFGSEDWDETKPYRDAGFLVMTPMLRGENGNPGQHELYYSEVDDAIAAGQYLASLPGVDPAHLFVAGHSAGATVSLLSALMSSPFVASTPIGGYVDMADLARYLKDGTLPFHQKDTREFKLRSAMYFPKSVKIPLYMLCGDQDTIAEHGIEEFAAAVRAAGQKCETIRLRGTHSSSKLPAILRSAQIFKSFLAG